MRRLSDFQERALKAREITRNAFPVDRKNTRFVAPAKLVETRHGWRVLTVTKEPRQRSRTHAVELRLPRGYAGTLAACPSVTVDCDCSRYLYTWNYALQQAGAAIHDRTNGESPVVTNPDEIPGICKHGLVAIGALLKLNPRWPTRVVTKSENPAYGKPVTLTDLHQVLKKTRR